MISERKKIILQTILSEYIRSAQPVSSGVLVDKYKLNVSPATVGNEMMELEEEFDIEFSNDEMLAFTTVADVIADLEKKLGK